MARQRPAVGARGIVAGISDSIAGANAPGRRDDALEALLDATADLLARHGVNRWSVDDVAVNSGVGRTTIYRRFDGRDDLVHAALGRELHRVFEAISERVGAEGDLEDRLVEGVMVALQGISDSPLARLLSTDPSLARAVLTDGELLRFARIVFAQLYLDTRSYSDPDNVDDAALVAEVLVRLGISFLLTPESVIDHSDEVSTRLAVRRIVVPLLGTARAPQPTGV